MKEVKISSNPSSSPVEYVEGLVMQVSMPYSDSSVTIKIDSSIEHYEEATDQDGAEIRQVIITADTTQTQTILFDLEGNNIKDITIDGKKFNIKLCEIGNEEVEGIPGQTFKFFKFEVSAE